MASKAADSSELFGSEHYSDVNLLIYEEAEEDSSPSQQADRGRHGAQELLPCHKLVLRALSPFFKAMMDNWSQQPDAAGGTASADAGRSSKAARTGTDQDAAAAATAAAAPAAAAAGQQQVSKPQVLLSVPSSQLALGHLLIKSMYEAEPDLSTVSQAELVQLVVLADRYQVLKVAAAAAEVIRGLPTDQLQWETIFAMYQSPMGLATTEAFTQLQIAAIYKVLTELVDLEVAWNDAEKQQLLEQLPFPILKRLLSGYETLVSSEDTVLHTIERWCAWQQQHMPLALQPTTEQLRELLGCVRMSYCSKVYVASIFAAGAVAEQALQRSELAQAIMTAGCGSDDAIRSALPRAHFVNLGVSPCKWPALLNFQHWADTPRAPSLRSPNHMVRFSAEQLERLWSDADAGAAAVAANVAHQEFLFSDKIVCYQGVPSVVGIMLQVMHEHYNSGEWRTTRMLSVAVKVLGLPEEAVPPCIYMIRAGTPQRPPQNWPGAWVGATSHRSDDGVYLAGRFMCGAHVLEEFRAWLFAEAWVQADDNMTLFCTQTSDGDPVLGN